MAGERGDEKADRDRRSDESPTENGDSAGLLPDLARRALAFGLSGFFLTEETIRKAVGDTLPRDWADFAADQSERTRKEFLERLSFELARSLEKVDVAAVLRELLEGRTLEVRAEIRLGEGGSPHLHTELKPEDRDG